MLYWTRKANKQASNNNQQTNKQTNEERKKKRSTDKITTNEPSPVVESKADDQIAARLKHRMASNETTNLNQNIVIDALGWDLMKNSLWTHKTRFCYFVKVRIEKHCRILMDCKWWFNKGLFLDLYNSFSTFCESKNLKTLVQQLCEKLTKSTRAGKDYQLFRN